jgi:hypothetical protein
MSGNFLTLNRLGRHPFRHIGHPGCTATTGKLKMTSPSAWKTFSFSSEDLFHSAQRIG